MKLRVLFLFIAVLVLFLVSPVGHRKSMERAEGFRSGDPFSERNERSTVRFSTASSHASSYEDSATVEAPSDREPDSESEPEEEKQAPAENNLPTSGSGQSDLRLDATYVDGARVMEALVGAGAVILLLDANHRLIARITADGSIIKPSPGDLQGVPRQATAEVAQFLGGPLPKGAVHGIVVWPSALWSRLTKDIPNNVRYARARLSVRQGELSARVQLMPESEYAPLHVTL